MNELFNKKKDPYIKKVALILYQTIGPYFDAYNLADECLRDLRYYISKGMFLDGSNPKENIMAYFCLCTLVAESNLDSDEIIMRKIFLTAIMLQIRLGKFESMSSLEKGIFQYGKNTLSEGIGTHSYEDIEKIKIDTIRVIMDLMRCQEVTVLDLQITDNVKKVSSNLGDRMVLKLGGDILSISVLSNATGYYIDQEKMNVAYHYYRCIGFAISKYFEGQMESYNDFQLNAFSTIMQDYYSLGEEIEKAKFKSTDIC